VGGFGKVIVMLIFIIGLTAFIGWAALDILGWIFDFEIIDRPLHDATIGDLILFSLLMWISYWIIRRS
tara:strand:+ start:571 stop:774 length:204 start_codon:yes stop_codon:yes gene_type:complete